MFTWDFPTFPHSLLSTSKFIQILGVSSKDVHVWDFLSRDWGPEAHKP